MLLEVTRRCDLRCRFCFANGGAAEDDPPIETLKAAITDIAENCGKPLLQLSGGEPTLRDDLPELVRYAKEAGLLLQICREATAGGLNTAGFWTL